MARKSRKGLENSINHEADSKDIYLNAGAYLRISQGRHDDPSESIDNQLKIIEDFVRCRPDITLKTTYRDIGVSGRVFERVGFQQLLADIEIGKINCVIVKNLSRFGRNHIETGYYIEKYFSRRGVRFISINDHAETVDGITNLNPYGPKNIPLINLMNEAVSNGLSRSKLCVLSAYASEGKYIAPRAPYGYWKDPDDCHRLIIDPDAAANVKMIFDMAQRGTALTEIVRNLNRSGILPPSLYARKNGLQGNYQDSTAGWNTRTLKKMLTNCTYVGKLIQGKEQIAAPDTHEPIISEAVFEQVQQQLSSAEQNAPVPRDISDNPLRGKVICGKCGAKMQRKRGTGHANWYFYTCVTKNRRGADTCSGEYIREDAILSAIKKRLLEMQPDCIEKKRHCEQQKLELEVQLMQLKNKQQEAMARRRAEYERFITGKYTKREYCEAVSAFPLLEPQIDNIEAKIEQINDELGRLEIYVNATKSQGQFDIMLKEYISQIIIGSGNVNNIVFTKWAFAGL